MARKANAVCVLDQLGIRYELREYELDPEVLACESGCGHSWTSAGTVFKTLVARGDRNGVGMVVYPRALER